MKMFYIGESLIDCNEEIRVDSESHSLSRGGAVAITAVVCVVCSFTAGLLLGVLLTRCNVHCHGKQSEGQTEKAHVYEDIPLENKKVAIELKQNEAYESMHKHVASY